MKNRKGISLIVLIITILVMIILAGVVIVNMSKDNPVKNASKSVFLQEISDLKEELKMIISKKIINKELKSPEDVNATGYTEIIKYIPDFPKKFADKFIIRKGELFVVKQNLIEEERKWLEENKIVEEYIESDIYIPKGFKYLEGSKQTGYVIKDIETGSEFVWINVPDVTKIKQNNYTNGGELSEDIIDNLNSTVIKSIEKYKGFYIARYEMTLENGKSVSKPLNKALITDANANLLRKYAENMYNTSDVVSIVPAGSMYDYIFNLIKEEGKNITYTDSWGMYPSSLSQATDSYYNTIVTSNDIKYKAKNIFGFAGGLWELTEETKRGKVIYRGGGRKVEEGDSKYTLTRSAVYRYPVNETQIGDFSVRPALILK